MQRRDRPRNSAERLRKRTTSNLCRDEARPFARSMTSCSERPTRLTAGRSAQRSSWTPSGASGQWTVHIATFFTDVRPELVPRFAKLHGIPARELAFAYDEVKRATGEANPAPENLL